MSQESSAKGLNGHSFISYAVFFTGAGFKNSPSLLILELASEVVETSLSFLFFYLLYRSISLADRFLVVM
jgi:hypothetical protein